MRWYMVVGSAAPDRIEQAPKLLGYLAVLHRPSYLGSSQSDGVKLLMGICKQPPSPGRQPPRNSSRSIKVTSLGTRRTSTRASATNLPLNHTTL